VKDVLPAKRVQKLEEFQLHMYGGKFHRVPEDWRFPRCGIRDLWRQWHIGDTVRNIPPLKTLQFHDIEHINMKPLTKIEKTRKVGPNTENRRLVTKALSEMRKVGKYLTKMVQDSGKWEPDITLESVDRMYTHIAHNFVYGMYLVFSFFFF
jgi:hypothetical protein